MSVIINISGRDWCWMGLTEGTYLQIRARAVPTLGTGSLRNSHIIPGAKQEEMTDIISPWSNIVDPYINTTDAICAGHKIIERAEIGNYFELFPLFSAAGQIGLIKEGKTGSFKVKSIINWSPQPKGLPGQGSIRKQLCCCAQSLGSHRTSCSPRYCGCF